VTTGSARARAQAPPRRGEGDPRPELTAAEPEAPVMPSPTNIRSVALTIVAVVGTIFALQYAQPFLIPIVLAVLVAYGLDPIVSALTRVKVPRVLAAALVVLTLGGSLGVGIYSLSDEAVAIAQQLPDAAQQLRRRMRELRGGESSTIEKVQQAANELERTASEAAGQTPTPRGVTRVQIEEPAFNARDYLMWGSIGLVGVVGQIVLLLFLVFFLLASGDTYKRKLVKIGGRTLSEKKVTVEILDDITNQIERFLLVQAATSTLVAIASYAAFRWFGLQQAGMWAIAAGVFNSIPYLGAVLVTAGVFVVAFLQFTSVGTAFLVAAVALVITSLEGMLLTPWLTSRAAQMNAVAVFVGLLFWSWVWGVWGALLAVPMLMVAKAICDRIEDLKPIGELLGD
jgi:predicted PurR-regulated permease PerM